MYKQINICFKRFIFCILIVSGILNQSKSIAQTFNVSFPINSTVYSESEILMTVVISGIKCENTAIRCHKGLVSMVEGCKYIYRSKTYGLDTIDVLIRKGNKLIKIGEQLVEVKSRSLPQASIYGLKGGTISKNILLGQQGVSGSFYIAANHWEICTIEKFDIMILRNGKILSNISNVGNNFTEETRSAINETQSGDIILVVGIIGCIDKQGGNLAPLQFTIE